MAHLATERKAHDVSFSTNDPHLHLMALEILVYQKAGRQDLLQTADDVYKNLIRGDYQHSWELVREYGPESFLKDLKQALK